MRLSIASGVLSALAAFAFLDGASLLAQSPPVRQFPDTANGIFVFSDQLDTGSMTEAQFQFAATHYVGSQKLIRDAARHLRQYNSNYLVLHYRLGQGLGFRTPDSNCQPTGSFIQIIDRNWVQEWPGDSVVQPNWFFQWSGQPRVYNCNFGWYLMELNDTGWRTWWSGQVIQQLRDNEDDGVFADSYSIPNYGFTWNPSLPVVDSGFESSWAQREHAFTDYMRARFAGRWKWIPNIGGYITTRDPSDYSNVDGLMIEQFAEYGGGSYLAESDWQLQMNRVLSLVGLDKILIAQTYPDGSDIDERMFDLGTYLLIKAAHTYVNLVSFGLSVQWLPEYAIDLGEPVDSLPTDISSYFNAKWNVYVRHYQKGLILVNPSAKQSGGFNLGTTYYQAIPSGGGIVGANGAAPGSVSYQAVSRLNVCAHCAAVLLNQHP
jgi:putative glycosyl hydrolase-like family 15 (GHL15) protein